MQSFSRGGVRLVYRDEGEGPALLFAHGLGGSTDQAFEIIGGFDGYRRIAMACRCHGESQPGLLDDLSLTSFSDDLLALLDHLKLERAHVGGISMGAAITTRLAVREPARLESLCIARPAWFVAPSPDNMAIFADAAAHMAVPHGRAKFAQSATFLTLAAYSRDNASSLLGQFDAPDLAVRAALLRAISQDGPGISLADYAALAMPVLVIGHSGDAVHPLAMARQVAQSIPGAVFAPITPKGVDPAAYRKDFQSSYRSFLEQHGARHA